MPTLGKYSLDRFTLDNFTLDKHRLDAFVLDGGIGGIDSYTKLMLHMDGADNGTTFTDECGHTVTRYGAVTKTGTKQFGTASGYFDGTDDYLSIADSNDWYFGGGDFTIDFWFHPNNAGTYQEICGQYKDANNCWSAIYYGGFDGSIRFNAKSGGTFISYFYTGVQTLSTDTFYHIAVVRNGNTPLIFIDGASQSITENTTISGKTLPNIDAPLTIGWAGNYYANCYKDEFRISKGIARWTSNFTPPVCAYY